MKTIEGVHEQLARQLVLDELFDLTLYKRLYNITQGDVRAVLGELIPVETKHLAFWQDFFGLKIEALDLRRRLKLVLLVLACRLFGTNALHLILEGIEVYGVRKYLALWDEYRGRALGTAVQEILRDEFQHEDVIVSRIAARKIDPEKIRSIFLGFNDGSVETLGAVSGFFAAFQDAASVLIAGLTVAVAGAISMGAGAFAALGSEEEMRGLERGKAAFLGERASGNGRAARPMHSAIFVGASYFIGALVPILPVLFGAESAFISIVISGAAIVLISFVLSFLSGMKIAKRITTNLVIIAVAVGFTYAIGLLTRRIWGVAF